MAGAAHHKSLQFHTACILLLLVTDITCRPLLRLPRGSDSSKGGKDSSPKEEKKDDQEVLFEGDIAMSLSDWLLLQQESHRQRRQAEESAPTPVNSTGTNNSSADANSTTPATTTEEAVTTTPAPPSHLPLPSFSKIWPNCRVPYKWDINFDNNLRIKFMDAMKWWEDATCIDFVPATLADVDYLILAKGPICMSNVGRRGGGPQYVMIADGCSRTGNAAHELGHAIGLWHEHSRPDRDNYITVHKDNILRNDYHNFDPVPKELFDLVPDVGYDIQSVMHYGPKTFSTTGNDTITIKEDADLPELGCSNTLNMGQRSQLSYKDRKRVSLLYGCDFTEPEPECIQPSPTTSPLPTTEAPTTMPTPSTTTKVYTPAPLSPKLQHGNVIALTFGEEDSSVRHGMRCVPSPGCTPVLCEDFGGDTCQDNENKFQIFNYDTSNRIKTGNTVLLRSFDTPSHWLDCSAPSKCVISQCHEDNVEDPGNSSYISNCSKHHFEVRGYKRGMNKLLSTNHKLQFKSSSSYLNCNGKRCALLEEDSCPNAKNRVYDVDDSDGQCDVERYEVIKISEL